MCVLALATALADPPAVSHDDSFSKEGLFKANVATLKDTQLVAHADVPLDPTKNVLWCGTMQLAWNKAIDLVGEQLQFTTPSPVADLLNRKDFTDADLDPASYVALADFEKNDIEDEIRAALEKTFQGAASPELVPEKPANPGPSDFVAYSYLYKSLVFAHVFKVLDPLTFGSIKVENFGFDLDGFGEDIFNQVSVYDYKSENDFIVKLKTKLPDDELILAKITPASTLEGTIAQVLKRMNIGAPDSARSGDRLAIPKLNFDLGNNFSDLEGLVLQPSAAAHIHPNPPLYLKKAEQLVRFQLNENGAVLKSEAVINMARSAIEGELPSPPPHIMIFDKPFLILMKRANSNHPYFALWLGNTSLLIPTKATIQLNPMLGDIYSRDGYDYLQKGATDKAIADFDVAIQHNPKLGEAYYSRALAYSAKGDYDKAIADCSQLIQLHSSFDAIAYKYRGAFYCQKGEYDKALADYTHNIQAIPKIAQNIQIDAYMAAGPSDAYKNLLEADAYDDRGCVYEQKGDHTKALADFKSATQADPTSEQAYNIRAWFLATCPQASLRNGKQAVEDAKKACTLSEWKEPNNVDTLAVACAETGDFDAAIKWEQYCLSFPNLTAQTASEFKGRVALFQAHKPYHADK